MKEVTYEDWQKNPAPRVMWVWDNESSRKKLKVLYILSEEENVSCFRVIALANEDSCVIRRYVHCAEIEEPKTRRMTYKELSRWLREKPTREYTYSCKEYIGNWCGYTVDNQDSEVTKDILIRENDEEWKEPLVEVTDD